MFKMISAAELRKLQESFLIDKEQEFIERFKNAVQLYSSILLLEAQNAIFMAQQTGSSYIFLNYLPLTQSIDGFYYTALLYGNWKGENLFQKHNIDSPLDITIKELDRFGYKLENVSDPMKSNRLYIKLSWG